MSDGLPPDKDKERRRAEILARRGSAEREAAIAAIQAGKAKKARNVTAAASGRKTPDNSADMFGHPWSTWHRMAEVGYEAIVRAARARTRLTYAQLWRDIGAGVEEDPGNHWRQLPRLLEDIAETAHDRTRLLLTALVVTQEADTHPGPGFFRLAAHYGLLSEKLAPPLGQDSEWVMTAPQRQFWEAHCHEVYLRFAGSGPT